MQGPLDLLSASPLEFERRGTLAAGALSRRRGEGVVTEMAGEGVLLFVIGQRGVAACALEDV